MKPPTIFRKARRAEDDFLKQVKILAKQVARDGKTQEAVQSHEVIPLAG